MEIKLPSSLCARLGMAVQREDTDRSEFIRQAVRDRAERILKEQNGHVAQRKISTSTMSEANGAPLLTQT